jgi:hypothetical protein
MERYWRPRMLCALIMLKQATWKRGHYENSKVIEHRHLIQEPGVDIGSHMY